MSGQPDQIVLPDKAVERLHSLSRDYQIDYDVLVKELLGFFNTEFMQSDATLKTQEDKLNYCALQVASNYVARQPLAFEDVIVVGLGRVFSTKSGGKRGEIYVITRELQKDKSFKFFLRSVSFLNNDVKKIMSIQTQCAYTVRLGKYKTGDLFADDRSDFADPRDVDISVLDLLYSLGICRCTVKTSIENLAKVEKTATGSYPVRTDWRIIRGMITSYNKGQNKQGQEWGVYTIFDDSLESQIVTPDGSKIVRPAFTVWVNPLWVIYEKGNEMDFIGPIQVSADSKEVFMTAYLLVPVRMMYGGIKVEQQQDG